MDNEIKTEVENQEDDCTQCLFTDFEAIGQDPVLVCQCTRSSCYKMPVNHNNCCNSFRLMNDKATLQRRRNELEHLKREQEAKIRLSTIQEAI